MLEGLWTILKKHGLEDLKMTCGINIRCLQVVKVFGLLLKPNICFFLKTPIVFIYNHVDGKGGVLMFFSNLSYTVYYFQ